MEVLVQLLYFSEENTGIEFEYLAENLVCILYQMYCKFLVLLEVAEDGLEHYQY